MHTLFPAQSFFALLRVKNCHNIINQINQSMYLMVSVRLARKLVYRYATKKNMEKKNKSLLKVYKFKMIYRNLPNCWKWFIFALNPLDNNSLPWKSSLKKIFEPFPTKFAGTRMTILTEGALVVANATAIKVSTRKAVRTDIKVEDWVGTVLVRRGASESWLFPSKVSVKVSIL